MTEKRFTLCELDLRDYGMSLNEIMDNGVPISQEKVIDLLNKLDDENKQLKQQLNDCREYNEKQYANYTKNDKQFVKELRGWEKSYDELKKENEKLKSENNMLKVTIGRNEGYIKRLTETSEWHC